MPRSPWAWPCAGRGTNQAMIKINLLAERKPVKAKAAGSETTGGDKATKGA